jgi:CRP-like cAMP-binding protein
MPKPPPLPSRPSVEHPLDRALDLVAAGDGEGALRWGTALVKSDLAGAAPLFVLGKSLSMLEKRELATAAFEVAADRASDGGNLPIAIAALVELGALGSEESARIDSITKTYAKGSAQLKPGVTTPPIAARDDVNPLPATLSGEPLIDAASQVVDYARASLDSDREGRAEAPKVPPQSLFSSLTAPALRDLVQAFEVSVVKSDEQVIRQGAAGAEAFVLARGELEVVREQAGSDSVLLARLGNGALFGEMALLSRAPRAASVIAARPSIVLAVRAEALEQVAARSPEVGKTVAAYCQKRMVTNLVRTSPLLGPLSAGERQALIERFSARTFETGERLIVQGKQADGLYVVASGQVSVVRQDGEDDIVVANLGVGEVVGEVSLVFRRASNASVVADHPTVTLHLPSDRFMEIVREHPTLLAQLYELAVVRDEETSSIVAQEAADVDELII